MKHNHANKLTVWPFLALSMASYAGAANLLVEEFASNDGGFIEEATGETPIPAVYNAVAGTWSMDGDDSGPSTNTLTSPPIAVTSTAGIQVSFNHRYSIEGDNWDGAGLQISIDGGEFKNVPASAFTENGYTNTAPLVGNHVLRGLDAFSGESPGYLAGTFITSTANVGAVAGGSSIQVRFVGAWDEGSRGLGLPNWEIDSVRVSTLVDTDGDGIPDVYEIANGLNPDDPSDATGDLDSDGLSNLAEFLLGTDPQDNDSDNDGYLDGVETNTGTYVDATDTGTDPLNPDTDGDGLLDGAENPSLPFVDKNQAGTNPLLVDTDGDGFSDGLEVLQSTSDPTNPFSRPLRSGLLDILAYWDFNDDSDPTKTLDLIKGFEGVLLTGGIANAAETTTYTADAGGRTGAAGDKAIDMGTTAGNGTGIFVELGEFMNIAAQQNQTAVSFWQKLSAINQSTAFRSISPSVNGDNRAFSAHATWSDSRIYFDTSGCCDGGRQRISGLGGSLTNLNVWRHVVFQKNGNLKEVWVDGVLVLSGTNTAPLPTDVNSLFIGTDNLNINMTGQIDDFAIFADALTSAEIAKLAAGDDPRSIVPSNVDADNDGMPDAWEVVNGLNPAIDDSQDDLDNDGLSNLGEFLAGTDPQNPDSDGDGLNDGVETNTGIWVSVNDTGTDPLNPDSDGDGLEDGLENPDLPFVDASQPGTDPNLADTDGDGFSDSKELEFGTDPTSAASVPDTLKLLVYYDFNGQTVDQTGNAPDAVLEAPAVLTPGGGGASGSSNDQALDLGDSNNRAAATVIAGDHFDFINRTGAAAVSFSQFNTVVANSSSFWLTTPGGGQNERGFQAHSPWGNGTVYFDIAGSIAGNARLTNSGNTLTGQWQHFVFQRTASGSTEIWIDGVLRNSRAGAPALLPLDGRITIGAEGNTLNNSFAGRIDNFAVYSDALNAEQIEALATGTTPPELFGPLTPFVITAISYNKANDRTTLTWNSKNGGVYAIDTSESMKSLEWAEVADDIASGGETTTFELAPQFNATKLFFRIRQTN